MAAGMDGAAGGGRAGVTGPGVTAGGRRAWPWAAASRGRGRGRPRSRGRGRERPLSCGRDRGRPLRAAVAGPTRAPVRPGMLLTPVLRRVPPAFGGGLPDDARGLGAAGG